MADIEKIEAPEAPVVDETSALDANPDLAKEAPKKINTLVVIPSVGM